MYELGNGSIQRRIHCISNVVATTSLVNVVNGEEYLAETNSEFRIQLTCGGQKAVLEAKDFVHVSHETPRWDESIRTLKVNLETTINDTTLAVSLFYEVEAGTCFLRKWLSIAPGNIEDLVVTEVTIEDLRFKEMVEGVVPRPRYRKRSPAGEDNVHVSPSEVDLSEPESRFAFCDSARSVVTFWGYGEGLYFFCESLLGEESFYRPNGLVIRQAEYEGLSNGLETGKAVIGAYVGPPEVGFKKYCDHLLNQWCVVRNKSLPVTWNTWLVTLEGKRPLRDNFTRDLLLDYIEPIREAGFYDVMRLDFGWEAGMPLRPDPAKFPSGLGELVRRVRDSAGLDMAYWINPFSSLYRRSDAQQEYADCLVPDKVSGRSGANALCVMTEYYDYVRQNLLALVTEYGARMIYWDGGDWNIPECSANNHDHDSADELRVKASKRLAALCDSAHASREELIISAFNLPFNNHRLCVIDQEQVSDTSEFETGISELVHRQQLYQMTFEHPYKAIYGSWYGLDWSDAGVENLGRRPLRALVHAAMSMIGNGLAQAGGALDLRSAPKPFLDFLSKLFAFRKRFERYFDVYQHVLGFPDGEHVDGEGHFLDGSGFIVLVNPADEEASVVIPIHEPELELDSETKHHLTDWTNLDEGIPIGDASVEDPPVIDLAPFEVRYVGVNIA